MKKAARNALLIPTFFAAVSGCEASFDSPSDQDLVQKTFDETKGFWSSRGIGLANSTGLIMLSGEATFTCAAEEPITSTDKTFYHCTGSGENAIIVPAAALNSMKSGQAIDEGAVKAGIRHEFGHVVQDGKPDVGKNAPAAGTGAARTRFYEFQATCFAGVVTMNIDPKSTPEIRRDFQSAETSEKHGTGAQQTAAYDQGYAQAALQDPFTPCAKMPMAAAPGL